MYALFLVASSFGQPDLPDRNNLLGDVVVQNNLLMPVEEVIPKEPAAAAPEPNSYMEMARKAVNEGKKLYVFLGRDAVDIPGAVTGRYRKEFSKGGDLFPGIEHPAVVISEPDGRGWLTLLEVRRLAAPAQFRAEQRTVQPTRQMAVPRMAPQSFRGGGRGRSSGSC